MDYKEARFRIQISMDNIREVMSEWPVPLEEDAKIIDCLSGSNLWLKVALTRLDAKINTQSKEKSR